MKNTYNLSRLKQRIQEALPRPPSPVGEAAIDGFLALTGISRWQPERLGILQLSFVFDIGLPFGLIGDNASVKPLATSVGDSVCDGRNPDPQLWRVVHAGALLHHWGIEVEFRGDGAGPSAQIGVMLPSGTMLDVDVGAAYSMRRDDSQVPGLQMIDARGAPGRHAEVAAAFANDFAAPRQLVGVVSFEPRFWVSIEQKEWIYRACAHPNAAIAIDGPPFGKADSGRQALRLALLEPASAQ
jgi:hypothetical protein